MSDQPSGSTENELQVLHLPHFDTNPYQTNLSRGLRDEGVSVTLTNGYPQQIIRILISDGLPDVLHLHWISPYIVTDSRLMSVAKAVVFSVGLFVAQILGIRIVWTAHNLIEHKRRHPVLEKFCKMVLVRYAFDRVFVHWPGARRSLVEEFRLPDSDKIVTVSHGNYINNYENGINKQTARSWLNLPEDTFVFLYFGNIRPYKQVPQLIESFNQIDADARLLVVGKVDDNDLRERVETLASADERVHTELEFVPEGEIQFYMNAADTVVFPFRDIFTSGSVLLAMSFGKAVIAPKVEYLTEMVGERGGILYDSSSQDGLTRAMREVMSRDVERIGDQNYETATRYTWESTVERTVDTYYQLVS